LNRRVDECYSQEKSWIQSINRIKVCMVVMLIIYVPTWLGIMPYEQEGMNFKLQMSPWE